MHNIDWEQVGDKRFNVFDPICGFWADEGSGFVKSQYKAKTYTQDHLTENERKTLVETKCILMSNPDPEPAQKPAKPKSNNLSGIDISFDM